MKPGDHVTFIQPEAGMNAYEVVFYAKGIVTHWIGENGSYERESEFASFYGEGYTPEQAIEYVREYAKNDPRIHGRIVEVKSWGGD